MPEGLVLLTHHYYADGPAGAALNPKPKDLAGKVVQAQTDGELFWKISTGRGGILTRSLRSFAVRTLPSM